MENVASALRIVHLVAASASLLVLGVPLVAKKGGALHRRVGWIWVAIMTVAIVTGLAIAAAALAWPAVMRPGVDPGRVRTFNLFLLLVGAMSASAVWQGVRATGRKRSPVGSRHPVDVGLPALAIALGLVVVALGIARASVLFCAFGLGSIALTSGHLRFAWRPLPSKMAWWYGHMNGMLGAVIVTITAFAIAGMRRFVTVPESLGWMPWIVPGVVLGPALAMWQRYYRERFGEGRATMRGGGDDPAR